MIDAPSHSLQPTPGCVPSPVTRFAATGPPVASLRSSTYSVKYTMKITYILTCTLPLLLLGCKRETQPVQSQTPAQPESKAVSDGTSTWQLGATTMNGTNIASSNITIRATTNRVAK